jgi:hypothetical protein
MEGRGGLFQYRQVVGRAGDVAVGDCALTPSQWGIWLLRTRSALRLTLALPTVVFGLVAQFSEEDAP